MSGVNSGSKCQVQRAKRKDYYGMNGDIRRFAPDEFLTYIYTIMEWQQTRLDEMNPDPTGLGIINSVSTYLGNAAKGLLITVIQICSSSRAGLTSNIVVPASSKMIASWIRDQIGSANIPVDTLDSFGEILAEYVRPVSRDTDIESFEVCCFFADAACDTPANTAVRLNAIMATNFAGGVLLIVPSPIACISAYKKYVQFKLNVLGIQPVAAPTTMSNNGWSLLRAVQQGNTFIILAGVSTENVISDIDIKKVILLERYHAVENYVPIFANWFQSPFQQLEVEWQRASQRIATTSLLFADDDSLKLLRGPTLTMWPAPFVNPAGAGIAGIAPGGGLLPAPIGPMAPLGAPPPGGSAVPAPGGVDVNAALAALAAMPGFAAAMALHMPAAAPKAAPPAPAVPTAAASAVEVVAP